MNGLPRCYRLLLVTFPLRWREQHGEALLSMLLEADEERGRDRPVLGDRLGLLARGLRERVAPRRRRGVGPGLALLVERPLAFDQTNGVIPPDTDDLDRRGMRIDRHHGRGGLDAAGQAPGRPDDADRILTMTGVPYFLVPTGRLEDWARLPEGRLRTLRRRRSIGAGVAAAVGTAGVLVASLAPLDAVEMGIALLVITIALVQLAGSISIVIGAHRQIRVIEYERGVPEERGSTWPT